MIRPAEVDAAIEELTRAGFLAPVAEVAEMTAVAEHGDDLRAMVERRTTGEPLAWITGATTFCGTTIQVHPGVYVPRPQTESMVHAAVDLLPDDGSAIDLCTGSGAIAAVLARRRPSARVVGTDLDPRAIACARANGVEAYEGDLDACLPAALAGRVDVMVAVVPYVPSDALHLLPRDVVAHEPTRALDGGTGGTELLARAVEAAGRWLRPGGWLLLELGADQDDLLASELHRHGFSGVIAHRDDDGDLRHLRAVAGRSPWRGV